MSDDQLDDEAYWRWRHDLMLEHWRRELDATTDPDSAEMQEASRLAAAYQDYSLEDTKLDFSHLGTSAAGAFWDTN